MRPAYALIVGVTLGMVSGYTWAASDPVITLAVVAFAIGIVHGLWLFYIFTRAQDA